MSWKGTVWRLIDYRNSSYPFPTNSAFIDTNTFSYNRLFADYIEDEDVFHYYPYPHLAPLPDMFDLYKCLYYDFLIRPNIYFNYPYPTFSNDPDDFSFKKTFQIMMLDNEVFNYDVTSLNNEPVQMGAFKGCKNVQHLDIPVTVTKLGKYTFKNSGLHSVKMAGDIEYYKSTFPKNIYITYWDVKNFTISSEPIETKYFLYEPFDVDNLIVYATMEDDVNTVRRRVERNLEIVNFDMYNPGVYSPYVQFSNNLYPLQKQYTVLPYDKTMCTYNTIYSNIGSFVGLENKAVSKSVSILAVEHRSNITVPSYWQFVTSSTINSSGISQSISIYKRENSQSASETVVINQDAYRIVDISSLNWEQGGATEETGDFNINSIYMIRCSDYISVENGISSLSVICSDYESNNLYFSLYAYSSNDVNDFLYFEDFKLSNNFIRIPSYTKYIRFVVRRGLEDTEETEITPSDLSVCNIQYYCMLSASTIALYDKKSVTTYCSTEIVENTSIETVPYVPINKSSNSRRLYFVSSIDSVGTEDVVFNNTEKIKGELISLPNFKIYYDYSLGNTLVPQVTYISESSYNTRSMNIITITIT